MPIETDYHTFWYRTYGVPTRQDDWRLTYKQKVQVGVWIRDLIPLCKDILEIPLDQIAYVSMHLSYDEFYEDKLPNEKRVVDLSYPGIVVPKLRNYLNLPYVLIDGRHRITKMKIKGMTSSKFYVISKQDLYKHIHLTSNCHHQVSYTNFNGDNGINN